MKECQYRLALFFAQINFGYYRNSLRLLPKFSAVTIGIQPR